jgi:hypothetical protein
VEAKPKYKASDFYGRCFIMTVEPLATKRRKHQDREQQQQQQQPIANDDNDIRAMPIQFHANNTFTAVHTNKILRGRFGVSTTASTTTTTAKDNSGASSGNGSVIVSTTTTTREELWFQVSLFGSGRSVRGSVYSEGVGLSHHDARTYVGEILQHSSKKDKDETTTTTTTTTTGSRVQHISEADTIRASTADGPSSSSSDDDERQKEQKQRQQRLFVAGSVTYGSDLGSDARPEPVGTFLLTEITTYCDKDGGVSGLLRAEEDGDDDDDDDDDGQDNDTGTNSTSDNDNSDGVFQ